MAFARVAYWAVWRVVRSVGLLEKCWAVDWADWTVE
jgi:hypothetical protein